MIYILRHGQTPYNYHHIFCGRSNVPLTQEGIRQAKSVADKLSDINFSEVFVSPLIRTQQTAKYALSKNSFSKEFTVDARIIERNAGLMEGEKEQRIIGVHYENDTNAQSIYDYNYDTNKAKMETLQSMQTRVFEFLDEVTSKHKGHNVLIVSHNGCIRMMRRYFGESKNESSFAHLGIDNAQLLEYEF